MIRALAMAVLVTAALGACSTDAGSCPRDAPATCPSTAPSFSGQVQALIVQYCANGCHAPDGTASDRVLQTYTEIFDERSAVLDQTYACLMPPPDSAAPSEADRVAILTWLVCGSPNN